MNLIKIQRYYLGLMAVISLGAVSCTNETEFANSLDKGDIAFSAHVGKTMSRATESAWDGDELIGVKAGETVKTYKVTTNGKMSTEDTPYTWDGTSYDLLAWTPLTAEQINLTDQTTEEKLFDCDLLASNAKVEAKNVHFVFRHKMTRMWWELQKFEGYKDEEVSNAKVSFIGYGSVTYTNGEITTVGDADQLISTHNTKGEYYRNGEAMMVPCEMWEKPLIKVEIGEDTYIYTPSKSNPNDVNKKTGDLLPNTWQRYYLSVSKKGLTVEMESGEINWDNEKIDDNQVTDAKFKATVPELTDRNIIGLDNNTIIGENFTVSYTENGSGGLNYEGICDIERTVEGNTHTYTFTNIATDIKIYHTNEYIVVGDYYYSDGTWGNNPDKSNCTTLGRVFKVGAHKTDSPELYTGMDKIRGYVVCTSLNDNNKYAWISTVDADYRTILASLGNTDDALKRNEGYLGYTLTTSIRAALDGYATLESHFPYWYAFTTLDIQCPDETSKWYIPSIAQLTDIQISGVYADFTGEYWSSNVYTDAERMWAYEYNANEKIYKASWGSDERKLILILTF